MSTATRGKSQRNRSPLAADWDGWSAHLTQRVKPVAPWRVPPGGTWPLAWSCGQLAAAQDAVQLAADLKRWLDRPQGPRTRQVVVQLEHWLAAAPARYRQPAFGLECLNWAYVLPALAAALPAAAWWEAWESLSEAAASSPVLSLAEDPLAHQWLAGELPLTLAYQFPELEAGRRLARPAAAALSAGVREQLDGDGLPAAEHLGLVRPLLACWTRCLSLADAAGLPCLDKRTRLQFEWFVRRALQLTRETGAPVFSEAGYTAADQALLAAALQLAGDEEDAAIADQILPDRARRRSHRQQLPFTAAAANTDWGHLAILRPDWRRGGQQLVVAHQAGRMQTELNCGEETVWSGEWIVDLTVDGRRLEPPSDWIEVCWHSDDDVDYHELEAHFGPRWVVQRQILLAREDRFVYLADAVIGPGEAEVTYRASLPLAAAVKLKSAADSWEGQLVGRRPLGLVLPLALPEWRSARAGGALECRAGGLQLCHTARTRRLYAPLFVDLDPRRRRQQFTWRQLTVAEQLQIQPPDRAVAYRVQVDRDQWLFYRSLAAAGNRTVLGQNLVNEFMAARFDTDGDVEELIRIDAE